MLTNSIKININSVDGTQNFARLFSQIIEPGTFICLYGPIGSGKTTFVQFVCKEFGIEEQVTSPSFVIINEYSSGIYPVYHFDLYRLEKEGIDTILSELEEYSTNNKAVTFVEWAGFSQNNLLDDRIEINFEYTEDFSDKRLIEICSIGNRYNTFIERLNSIIVNCEF